jgi:hypothetical protein
MESNVGVNPLVVAAVVANSQLLNLQQRSCENSINDEEEKDSSDEGVETLEFEGTPVAVWNRRIVEGWDVDPAVLRGILSGVIATKLMGVQCLHHFWKRLMSQRVK